MATEPEIKALYLELLDAYPAFEPRSQHPWEAWARQFAAVPLATLRQAAHLHIARSRFFPAIAEIHALLRDAQQAVLDQEYHQSAQAAQSGQSPAVAALIAERQRLDDLAYAGHLDQTAWQALLQKLEQLGLEYTAAYAAHKLKNHQGAQNA